MTGSELVNQTVMFDDEVRQAAESMLPVVREPLAWMKVDSQRDSRRLPPELTEVLAQVIEAIARGGAVTVSSMPEELTTTVAARELGISRPTLMKMIRNGEISARRVGTHHRVRTDEVQRVRADRLARQRQAFEELRDLEEELSRIRRAQG